MKITEITEFEQTMRELYPTFKLGNQTMKEVWSNALKEYSLEECKKAIKHFYVSSKTSTIPTISHLKEIIIDNRPVEKRDLELPIESLDTKYMHQDVESGCCHHNLYFYTEALIRIKQHEFPFVVDCQNPTHNELLNAVEYICEQKKGKRNEFMSKNDLITAGYDMTQRYDTTNLVRSMVNGKF